MHKEDLDTKIGDKFLVENTLLTQKVKPQKEKKIQKVSSPTPKKLKKKFIFRTQKNQKRTSIKKKTKKKYSNKRIIKFVQRFPKPKFRKNQKKRTKMNHLF